MEQTNVKWHRMTSEDVVSELHTNAACGLTRKAARSRSRKFGKNTLFDEKNAQRKKTLQKTLLTDASLWLLFVFCILALCLGQIWNGILALLCILIGIVFFWRWIEREKRIEGMLVKYRIPWVSVIRDGKRIRISAREIVPGDVILLKAGDTVPSDCRILTMQDLSVHTLQPDENGRPQWLELPKNADFVYSFGSQEFAPCFVNMLYGGSRILKGEVAAIAVATGEACFLASMQDFSIPAEVQKNEKGSTAALKPFLKLYGILTFLLLIPLTVIGVLVLPKDRGVMDLFFSLAAMLGIASPALFEVLFQMISLQARKECFRQAPAENRAVLKSERAMDRLAAMSDVFVMGSVGASDGSLHLHRCATGRGELSMQKGESYFVLQPLCEAFLLLSDAVANDLEKDFTFPSWNDLPLCRELIEVSSFDVEAMQVRIKHVALLSSTLDEDIFLEVQSRTDSYRVQFSQSPNLWSACSAYENDGTLCAMDTAAMDRLNAFYDSAQTDGCRVLTVIKTVNGRRILLGILAIRDCVQQTLSSVMEELKQSGVRVTFFFSSEELQTKRYLLSAGLFQNAILRSEAFDQNKPLTECVERHRVLVGFSAKEIATLIATLRKEGRRIALMGNSESDAYLAQYANLSIACDSTAYHKHGLDEAPFADPCEDGLPQSACASQTFRRTADILVARAEEYGGGLFAVLQALANCRAARVRMRMILPLLAASQLLCILFTAFSALLGGAGLMNGPQILFTAFLLPLAMLLTLLHLSIPQNRLRKWMMLDAKVIEKTILPKSFWLPILVATFGTVLYCLILYLCKVLSLSSATSMIAVSYAVIQLALFVETMMHMKMPILHRAWLPIWIWLTCFLSAIILSCIIPPVATVTGLGNWTLLSSLSLLLPPVLFFGTRSLMGFFVHRTSK